MDFFRDGKINPRPIAMPNMLVGLRCLESPLPLVQKDNYLEEGSMT
jgi:hypothetical protein